MSFADRTEGAASENISLNSADVKKAANAIAFENGANKDAAIYKA